MKKIGVTNEPFVQELLKEQRLIQLEREILQIVTGKKLSEVLEVLATILTKIAKQA